jgi:sucrose-6F-phosphate phosphohydrolase
MIPRLLVSDVDDTLLGGPRSGVVALMTALARRPPGFLVAWNSSRPCASLRETLAHHPDLDLPDYQIGALGTEMVHGETGEPVAGYQERFSADTGWNRARIVALVERWHLTPHPAIYQTPFKVSWHLPDPHQLPAITDAVNAAGCQARLILSGGNNLDIIPATAGKQVAITFLAHRHHIPPHHIAVAGDSGNDRDMFIPPWCGIVVGNADPDLQQLTGDHLYHARGHQAEGVLEGLRHWRFLP